MTYVGHTVGGTLAAVVALRTMPAEAGALIGMAAAAILGSLAPDLDHRSAYLSRRVWPLRLMLGLVLSNPITWMLAGGGPREGKKSKARIWRGRARVRKLLSHRQITHSTVGLVGGTVLWVALGWGLWAIASHLSSSVAEWMSGGAGLTGWLLVTSYGWALGWASHILLDAMTVSGVPLFLPMSTRRVWVLPAPLRVRSTA